MTVERVRRGQMSRIEQLGADYPDIKSRIDALLRGGVSQVAILQRLEPLLAEVGERPLSSAGLSRYAREMEAVGRDLRETRMIADAWTSKLGEEPSGNVGAFTNQILQTVALKAARRAWQMDEENDDGADIEMVGSLALTLQRLERAANLNVAREREIRKEVATAAAERAVQSAEEHSRATGNVLPAEVLHRIRRDVYGIIDAA